MVPQPRRCGVRRLAALPAVLTAVAALSLVSACDKVPLLAPSGSVITLFPTATSVPINGSIEIVATVIENGTTSTPSQGTGGGTTTSNNTGAGTPVQNGTVVSFTTNLGRVEPAEARTQNGQVRVRFFSNGQSGQATITAYSGGASGKIENLPVGAAAAGRITLSSSGNIGPSGGTTTVSARVEDESGSPLAGIPVTFRTSTGSVSPSTATTDQNGIATTTLTTNANATVTATAGSQSSTLDVALAARLLGSVTVSPQAATVGQPVTVTVTAGTNANISNAVVNFGDGRTQQLNSFTGSATATHVYSAPGQYTISVTASDALGGSQTQSTTVTVGTLPVTLTASPSTTSPNSPITFTVGGVSGAQVYRYRWDFGDGTTRETSGPQTTHSYSQRATWPVRVEIIGLAGNVIGTASTQVVVTGL